MKDTDQLNEYAVNTVAAVKRNEAYFAKLATSFEKAGVSVICNSLNGAIKTWNKACVDMFGYAAKEVIEKNISLIIPSKFKVNEKTIFNKVVKGKTVVKYESFRIKKDLESFQVEVTASPLKNKAGEIVGVCKIIRDITIEKQLKETLNSANMIISMQQTEKEQRAAELAIANVELVFQNKEKNNRANELLVANKELSYQNKEKESRAAELLMANVELAFQNKEKKNRANELLVANKELSYQNKEKKNRAAELLIANKELSYQNKEKEQLAADLLIANIELVYQSEEKQKRDEKIKTMRLEQQQSAAHFRSIFDNTVMGILLLDRDCNVVELNNQINFFTNIAFGKQPKKMDNLLTVIPEHRKQEFADKFAAVLTGEVINYESDYVLAGGKKIFFQVNIDPIITLEGNITGTCIIVEDISKRKIAEQAIRQREILNKSILTSIRSHIAAVDENGFILEVNDAWANFSINNCEPAMERTGKGKNYIEVCRKAVASGNKIAEKVLNGFCKVSKNESPFFEIVYPCHSPQEDCWFQLVITKFVGDSRSVVMKHTDITRLTKASKDAADYKNALDQSSILSITDQKGIIKDVNENFSNISQYSAEELIGKDHCIVKSGYHPKSFFKQLRATIGSGNIWQGEICNKAKDGSLFWVDMTIVPFLNEKGKPFQYVAIQWDITKRKIAETRMSNAIERYDILAQATSDTIWDWDIVNNTMHYNEGITKMFGYNAAQVDNIVNWWKDKLHSDDYKKVTALLKDVFEKGLQRVKLNYRFRCADGSYKHIFDRAFVIFDNQGKPVRMIGAMQDITYQSEEEIRITKATIDAQEQERCYLGAELHDNINQILAGTLLTLGVAKTKEADAPQRTCFINAAMGYITDAINETRKLSHCLAPAGFEDNSLKELFENLLLTINLENQFTVKLDFDELKDVVIPKNIKINLFRILQEQTKNILKYAQASTIEITVKSIDNVIMLRIFDNGKGFDTKAKKTGIGMSNIKKRAQSLSGKFMLHSAPGKGCEIIVEIPMSDESDQNKKICS